MASDGTPAKNRPLSPHLLDGWRLHWRWGPAMFVSIMHRLSGNGLAFAGIGILLWWLGALAGGPASYAHFTLWMWADLSHLHWVGFVGIVASLLKIGLKLTLIGVSWAFFNHMASGLRHFVLDVGAGFELKRNALWSVLTPIVGVLLTAGFWAYLLLR